MFYRYLIANEDGKDVLYLYVNDFEEYAKDDMGTSNPETNIYRKTYQYLDRLNIPFTGKRVNFVTNGIVASHINLDDYNPDYDEMIEVIEPSKSDKFIDFESSEGIIKQLKLDEYIYGIISSEMPAIFNLESLKAQAIIARTYAIKRLSRELPIRNFSSTKAFKDKSYLEDLWADKYDEYNRKIKDAIRSTDGEVIKFEGDYIDAYYHLSSNGRTEDSGNVLKLAYPYLVSVDSSWDIKEDFVSRRMVPNEYLSRLLNIEITKETKVDILMKTIGHRVKYIKFGDKVFDGLIISRKLGLYSNDFTVSIEDDYTTFTTRGHGHGLGLSKYGAEAMARAGYNYRQIISHYYPNTYIENIN